jgi:hypothetical protein
MLCTPLCIRSLIDLENGRMTPLIDFQTEQLKNPRAGETQLERMIRLWMMLTALFV